MPSNDQDVSGPASAADYAFLQAALDRKGEVRLNRTYVIASTLTISGETRVIGDGNARIVWKGLPGGSVLRDSSVVDPTRVNRRIVLENFELIGDPGLGSDPRQVAIDFYRTGSVVLRGLTVRGFGGSGIRWGNSYQDTTDVLVENCTVYDCRAGDAIQGSGKRIVIRNNTVGLPGNTKCNFGDTGIALIADFDQRTNPHHLGSSDVRIEDNVITGNYASPGKFVGTGNRTQTGIAAGPFAIDTVAGLKIARNIVQSCYVNIWVAVMRGVTISGNRLGAHSSVVTANLRLDGVSEALIANNDIKLSLRGQGPDYAAILMMAQRNQFGASVFDASIDRFSIRSNRISAERSGDGIRLGFGQVNRRPDFVSRLSRGAIVENRFTGVPRPIIFAPSCGETPRVCSDIAVRGNVMDGHAETIVFMAGKPAQYERVSIAANEAPANLPLKIGTGAGK